MTPLARGRVAAPAMGRSVAGILCCGAAQCDYDSEPIDSGMSERVAGDRRRPKPRIAKGQRSSVASRLYRSDEVSYAAVI